MAWYRITENVLDAIANAINAKTGKTAPMTPVDMVSEIQSIPTGGGSSLPSSVNEIAGGSFTLATNTQCDNYSISHNMTNTPKRFVIWRDDAFDDANITDTSLFIVSLLFSRENVVASGGTFAASYAYIYYRYSDKRISVNNGNRTEAQMGTYLGADFVKFADTTAYYQAGKTYKWIAWA